MKLKQKQQNPNTIKNLVEVLEKKNAKKRKS